MARPERFELPTSWFVARRSIQLSYGRKEKFDANPARGRADLPGSCVGALRKALPSRVRGANITTMSANHHSQRLNRPTTKSREWVCEFNSLRICTNRRECRADLGVGTAIRRRIFLYGGEGGIARGFAARPSLRSGPPSRTLRCHPSHPICLGRTPKTEVPTDFVMPYGGEGGIRTLEGLLTLTPLAGARLRPLGHLSGFKTQWAFAERGMIPARSSPGKAKGV